MPIYEIETDDGVLEIEHDGDPADLAPAATAWFQSKKDTGKGRVMSGLAQAGQALYEGIGTGITGLATVGKRIDEARLGGDEAATRTELKALQSTIAKADAGGLDTAYLKDRARTLEGGLLSFGQGKAVQKVGEAARGVGESFEPNPAFEGEFLASTVPSVAGSAGASLVQMATGAGPALLFGQVYQATLERNLAKGTPVERAHERALQEGIISGGLESVGTGIVARIAKRLAGKGVAPNKLKEFATGVVAEFLTGSGQEITSEVIDEEKLQPLKIVKAGALEAMGAGMVIAPAIGIGKIREAVAQAPETLPIIEQANAVAAGDLQVAAKTVQDALNTPVPSAEPEATAIPGGPISGGPETAQEAPTPPPPAIVPGTAAEALPARSATQETTPAVVAPPPIEDLQAAPEGAYWYQGVSKDGKSSWVTSNLEKARQYVARHKDGVINVFTPDQVGETAFADQEGQLLSPQEYAKTQSKDTTIQTKGGNLPIPAFSIPAAATQAPKIDVATHLKPTPAVQAILDSQPATPSATQEQTPAVAPPIFQKGFKLKSKEGGFINGDVLTDIGRTVAKTAKDFAAWSREMLRRIGDAIKPHLEALWQSLSGQNILPEARQSGAVGGTGRRTPAVAPIGATPRGDKNWLRIPPWFKRAGRGLFTEGTRAVLGRTKNQVGIALGKATRQHVDLEQELYGQHDKILRDAVTGVAPARQNGAFTEIAQYIRNVENGRPTPPLAPDAQQILDAWYEVGESTGDIARANNVQVWDASLGAYRPMGHVTNYIPRMFSKEVEQAMRDPEGNATLFNNLAQAIATHKGITIEAAAAELNGVASRFTANDFHGNLELARLEQLPEIFYEYDLRNLAARYLPAFSERMAQIIAYGQRLGTREAPSRLNLWDIARRESRDTETQQWLTEAEDQATGFKPNKPGPRIARRAQAVGNAVLLSDPTTTVVRNLLSGLSVTSERFGIGRSLRELAAAGKTASRMDAREIGAIRDDIGSFLGAEDLGDSKFDNAIRKGQQVALKASGFTGSETFVRTQNALTASTFARDAARALSANPGSALAREALAYFKRFDVDPEAIVTERGEWKTGPETRKFIRTAVRESQGGYRFDQVPLWAGTTTGRFIYQYGRWGLQRANDIFKNTIRPALGESVEFRGQTMTRRNVLPLLRLGLMTVTLGEAFAAIASLLFDRDRRDSSLSEIAEALTEDQGRAIGLLGERIVNDIIMAGTLGLIGQPIDFIKSVKDQSRFKNPLDPPALSGVKALIDLSVKAKDQGGSLTNRDLLDAAASLVRGPKNVSDVARNVADEKLYEAQNDIRTLRNAARRWSKTQGMDVASKIRGDAIRKTLNAPVFEAVNNALISGDATKARKVADEFINKAEDKKKARAAVRSSVEGRHPFRAGPFSADKYQKQFLAWAKKNLPPPDMQQIERSISTYETAAEAAGLE